MLDMDQYDEPDPDSDFDYEESYSSKRKRRKGRGGSHHPARGSHPPAVESPAGKRSKVIFFLFFYLFLFYFKFFVGWRPWPKKSQL